MASAQNQYTNEMKNRFGYYATWHPGVPLKLGDYGLLKGNIFARTGNISEYGIEYNIRPDDTKTPLIHNSQGNVTITSKLSGSAAPVGSALTSADAGIIVEFSKENSTLFKANNTTTPSIENPMAVGKEVIDLFQKGTWDKHWVIITELVNAESASIIISNKSNAKIELKANANIDTKSIDIADAKFDFSSQYSQGLETEIISQEAITPLFKVMGIKTRIFQKPEFSPKPYLGLDYITPTNSAKEYKDDIYFGYISDNQRE